MPDRNSYPGNIVWEAPRTQPQPQPDREGFAALFNGRELKKEKFPHQIAFNCIPHIDVFMEDGYTKEEWKMIQETRKILGEPNLPVTATTVRVPVFLSHSESVNVETVVKISAAETKRILREAPGIIVTDEPENNV